MKFGKLIKENGVICDIKGLREIDKETANVTIILKHEGRMVHKVDKGTVGTARGQIANANWSEIQSLGIAGRSQ